MFSENARQILEARYLRKDSEGNIIETPDGMLHRVAKTVSDNEEDSEKWNEEFYNLMASLRFLPNSPTLMNAGTGAGTLSGCFVAPIDDCMSSILDPGKFGIMDAVTAAALIQKFGGGCGFSLSRLRPKGTSIRSTHGRACGIISVLRQLNEVANMVTQGGKREGANMGVLRCDHPDIEEFIHVKENLKELPNFNLSVGVTDAFMLAVQENEMFPLVDPRNGHEVRKIRAHELYDEIIRLMHANGEPGVIFLDTINRDNPTPHIGAIEATNPCGEVPLLPFESCNLASINLAKFVKDEEVTWDILRQTVSVAVRFLDNIIDINKYPLKQIEEETLKHRKIGLGVMGWADMLSLMGIQYDSSKGVQLGRDIMRVIQEQAHLISEALAVEKGTFPSFEKNNVVKVPRRNATLTTIAPTGSIAKIAGCSAGIEPHFGVVFRARILEKREFLFTCDSLPQVFTMTEDLMGKVFENGGRLTGIKEIPKSVQKIFPIAHEIKPEWHLQMQAAFQEYTDNAISKSINLPQTATIDEMKNVISMAYNLGCKGVTVYRSGSRPEQVITLPNGNVILPEDIYIRPKRRPKKTTSETGCYNVGSCGCLYITLGRDPETGEPVEEFGTNSSPDSGCQSLLDVTGKLISLTLRSGFDPKYLAGKLDVQACHACGAGSGAEVRNCAEAFKRMLEESLHLEAEGRKIGPRRPRGSTQSCPLCHSGILIRKSASCQYCPSCGHELCGG